MTVTRKLQFNKFQHGYHIIPPKQIIEAMGWKKGDALRFSIEGKTLIITPEAGSPAKIAASGDHAQPLGSGGNE